MKHYAKSVLTPIRAVTVLPYSHFERLVVSYKTKYTLSGLQVWKPEFKSSVFGFASADMNICVWALRVVKSLSGPLFCESK